MTGPTSALWTINKKSPASAGLFFCASSGYFGVHQKRFHLSATQSLST